MNHVLILHYHEIWLKGGNKRFFLSRLIAGVKAALADLPVRSLRFTAERLLLYPADVSAIPLMVERLQRVFGLAYVALAREVPGSIQELRSVACDLMVARMPKTFAVRAKIAASDYPLNSMELERDLGQAVLDRLRASDPGVQVNLRVPEATCYVEVIPGAALLYVDRHDGPGGLPAATSGRLVTLLSGGFDSAVAAYKMMRRGGHVTFAHFFGNPSPSHGPSTSVAREIVRRLTPYQFTSRLYLIPFDAIQRRIVSDAPERFRVLLYRRMMTRIAHEIARAERALGLVTGDCVSQVASQTLHNLAAMDHALGVTIYRPLAGEDKTEILGIARKIGTYRISCEPFEDCCPRFMPKSPAIFAKAEELVQAESAFDIDSLVTAGLAAARVLDFKFEHGQVIENEGWPRRFQKLVEFRRNASAAAGVNPSVAPAQP
ncbi:MAG TPA: tRNA uracil 4-sulfurtransferase ThiI [Terriglobia bacterium]|jgi:thiamine biosynthesis protein ThiI|nr:tRNA uracil 4-sulfurtransferase ThiI [Terriglobia bacterium]